ncbi:MAG: vWA domain-containing protein [Hyphomicrobium sp.]|nr:vWA domain-containing protein [Hyphomicrobium sp.]
MAGQRFSTVSRRWLRCVASGQPLLFLPIGFILAAGGLAFLPSIGGAAAGYSDDPAAIRWGLNRVTTARDISSGEASSARGQHLFAGAVAASDAPGDGAEPSQMPDVSLDGERRSKAATDTISDLADPSGALDIALVLDVTNSMSGPKLAAMKTAAKHLVDRSFAESGDKNKVRIAVVPFGDYVNVGVAHRNAPWLLVPHDSAEEREACFETADVIGKSNCRKATLTALNDGVPYAYQTEACDEQRGPTYRKCVKFVDQQSWHGCAASRSAVLDVRADDWSSPVPASMNTMCGSPMRPLSSDSAGLKSYIDGLRSYGETYIPAGLFWGWAALSKTSPLAPTDEAGATADNARKILVLMTDGAKTRSADYAAKTHAGSKSHDADRLTRELCTNIKSAGITIYTVALDVNDLKISGLLESCATDPGTFREAKDGHELDSVFQSIGSAFSAD